MLITHVRPTDLWGKKVYDEDGRLLGEVVGVASRHGVVRKVAVRKLQGDIVKLPQGPHDPRPRLRVLD